jgi:DnaK suppressor protein
MGTSTRFVNNSSLSGRRSALLGLLRAQQDVLREQRRSLRETPPLEAVVGADDEERAAQEFEVGLDIALLEMRSRQVQEIEAALQLLESGTYGLCVDCDERIVASRLLARPFAVRCRTCQEAVETDGREPSATAALTPSREDWALAGSPAWRRNAEAAPRPRRKQRPMAVPVKGLASYGGASL